MLIGIVLVVAVAVFIVVVLTTQLRAAARMRRASWHDPPPGPRPAPGSSAAIADAGKLTWPCLLDALALADEAAGGEDIYAHRLGLRDDEDATMGWPRLNRMHGKRAGRQVEIRIGHDQTLRDGLRGKHLRQVVLIRVASPPFELRTVDGRPAAVGEAPAPLRHVLATLSSRPEVWRDLHVTGGSEGIVSNRPLIDNHPYGWAYDLWLLERLADRLEAPALPHKRLGRRTPLPYGQGKAT
jgi:hypothetical protein